MDVNMKYKRWGWGAIIGLAVVIVIAGLVLAFSLNAPKSNEEVATSTDSAVNGDIDANSTENSGSTSDNSGTTNSQSSNSGTSSNSGSSTSNSSNSNTGSSSSATSGSNSSASSSTGTTNSNLPKTGPEDYMLSFGLAAVAAYLLALNLSFAKQFQTRQN